MRVPLLPLQTVPSADRPLVDHARLPAGLRDRLAKLALRSPPVHDKTRWKSLSIGGIERRFAQPITFTPYASAQPCSARCGFCSENLRHSDSTIAAARLRPDDAYFDGLAAALMQLRDLPLSWSLSGLENTDDADWFLRLLDTLRNAERAGAQVEQRVLYSNGAGFAGPHSEALQDALVGLGLDWIELSRHHLDAQKNQDIMRFRDGIAVQRSDVFEALLPKLALRIPVKLVCIVQRDGVCSADAVARYLDTACKLGASSVIFRELSKVGDDYRVNATARHIAATRVHVDTLVGELFADPQLRGDLEPVRLTEGYYFWNLVCRWRNTLDVIFEAADYTAMHQQHDSGRIYKLVYFANGELCGGWEPGRHVLWKAPHGQQ